MKSIVSLCLCVCLSASAQDAQQEINQQVWKSFVEAFNNRDAEKFMSVHSKDVVRSPRDSRDVIGWDEYNRQTIEGNKRGLASGRNHSIELRFTERIAKDNRAIDVGIYKTTTVRDGQPKSFYGRFHVVLRKEDGVWKILVDTDSSEGGTIGERQFAAAKPME